MDRTARTSMIHSLVSKAATALAVALLGLPLRPASAAEIEGVRFAERVEIEGQALALHSVGLLRYRWIFKGYVAALYLEPGGDPGRVLEDVPKRLEIEYFWDIGAEKFGEAAIEVLERDFDAEQMAALQARLDRLHGAYVDVKDGDRYAITYLPGRGTSLSHNGSELVSVPGADLAAAYFGIWLGANPVDDGLREQLLEGR